MDHLAQSGTAQPLTFRGIAAFGHSSLGRLVLFQGVVAALAAAVLVLFFETAWVPVIRRTIAVLPPAGEIRQGILLWPPGQTVRATGSTFLGINIDPTDTLDAGEGADVQLEFRRTEFRFRSLFGYLPVPYPAGYVIALNRTELEPWWGAWHPVIIAGMTGGFILMLFGAWAALGLVYAWPVRLISFYADRQLSWLGAWKVAAGCLLPGALFLAASGLAYLLHRLNLVQLLGAFLLHLMIGWVYVLCVPFCLPRVQDRGTAPRGNPFAKARKQRRNPFAREDR